MRCFGMTVRILEDFIFFDTETLEHTPINNPYRMFYKIFYEDTNYQTFDTREYENKIVKVNCS